MASRGKNAGVGVVALILLAGSLLLLWFVILSGVTDVTPLNKIYFLRADTSGITGARDVTQWTYFYFCGRDNRDCGNPRPAPPFGKAWSPDADNVPRGLSGSHGNDTTSYHIYYMWRFGWVFFLITLFFETLGFFAAFLSCFGRLGAAIAFSISGLALFFHSLGTALMTATFVEARNDFRDDGRNASIGNYAFGFIWASWGALLIATALFIFGIFGSESKGYSGRRFRRKRSVRDSSANGRRVKDEYAQKGLSRVDVEEPAAAVQHLGDAGPITMDTSSRSPPAPSGSLEGEQAADAAPGASAVVAAAGGDESGPTRPAGTT